MMNLTFSGPPKHLERLVSCAAVHAAEEGQAAWASRQAGGHAVKGAPQSATSSGSPSCRSPSLPRELSRVARCARRGNPCTLYSTQTAAPPQPRTAARANYSHSQQRVRQILAANDALVRRLG